MEFKRGFVRMSLKDDSVWYQSLTNWVFGLFGSSNPFTLMSVNRIPDNARDESDKNYQLNKMWVATDLKWINKSDSSKALLYFPDHCEESEYFIEDASTVQFVGKNAEEVLSWFNKNSPGELEMYWPNGKPDRVIFGWEKDFIV